MNPLDAPLQAVEASPATRTAAAEAVVCAAWREHHAELFAFLVRTTHDPDDAEDLLQEAFLRLTREVRAGRTPDNVRAWLYQVGANLAVSRGRRIAAGLRGLLRMGRPPAASRADELPEARCLEREGHRELAAVLDRLAPDARAALFMSSEGFSGAEIGAAIGRTDVATRTLLCRTRVRVRRDLEGSEAVR